MKIAVLGPGAMGMLFASQLSVKNEVILVGNNQKNLDAINRDGIAVTLDGETKVYPVKAYANGSVGHTVDLVIVLTKAYLTESVLKENLDLFSQETVLMTLQNGAGHEEVLTRFRDRKHVLIGSTQLGASRMDGRSIRRNSASGATSIGALEKDFVGLDRYLAVFAEAGLETIHSDDIRQTVWNKLMINASSSVLSGVLQMHQGYVIENASAWEECQCLIREICAVANASGLHFDEEEQIARLWKHLSGARSGLTSIYSDIKNGRKTEVDFINGTVSREGKKLGVETPHHDVLIHLVHAVEEKTILD